MYDVLQIRVQRNGACKDLALETVICWMETATIPNFELMSDGRMGWCQQQEMLA